MRNKGDSLFYLYEQMHASTVIFIVNSKFKNNMVVQFFLKSLSNSFDCSALLFYVNYTYWHLTLLMYHIDFKVFWVEKYIKAEIIKERNLKRNVLIINGYCHQLAIWRLSYVFLSPNQSTVSPTVLRCYRYLYVM